MSKKVNFRLDKVARPPEGIAWVWHTIDLLSSPAWKVRSNQLAKLLDLLELEHLRHGGAENGHLKQTYSQIDRIDGGVSSKFIAAAIAEGEELGLIEAHRGMRKSVMESHMTTFRLTYLPAKVVPEFQDGKPYYVVPSNDWKGITPAVAAAIARRAQDRRMTASGGGKVRKCRPEREPIQFPNGNSDGSRTGTGPAEHGGNARPENCHPVPEREHPSISWEGTGDEKRPNAQPATASPRPDNITAPMPAIATEARKRLGRT